MKQGKDERLEYLLTGVQYLVTKFLPKLTQLNIEPIAVIAVGKGLIDEDGTCCTALGRQCNEGNENCDK